MGALATAAPEFWIKADAITGLADGDPITSVADQSGNSYTATGGANKPVYKTGISPSGLPVMRFDPTGGSKSLASAAPAFGSQTVIAVVKFSTVAAGTYGSYRAASAGSAGLQLRRDNGPNLGANKQNVAVVGATTTSPLSAGTFYVIAFRFTNATSYDWTIDGTSVASGSTSTNIALGGATTFIGYNPDAGGGEALDGDLGELASWSRVLTNTEVSDITAELQSKWLSAPSSSGTVAAVSGVSGTASGLYPASGGIAATSGVSGSATLVPQSTAGTVQVLSSVLGSASVITVPVHTFTPPTTTESSSDPFFGRYKVTVGMSVVWDGTTFVTQPYPWLGDIASLSEGETWFQGGRTYEVSDATRAALNAAGYTTT